MKRVEIFTTPWCPYCHAAKDLLSERGVPFEEQDVSGDPALRTAVRERSGRSTVPQIFIGGEAIGGYEELARLDRDGALLTLMGAAHGEWDDSPPG